MLVIVYSILFGVFLGEVVRSCYRWWQQKHGLTPEETALVQFTVLETYEVAKRKYATENALLKARLAIHGLPHKDTEGTERAEKAQGISLNSLLLPKSVRPELFSDIDANDL